MNMYAPQASIDPSLAALLQTAAMVTPDKTPTVAAQVAQAAQQKLQPQGIMQGIPQAKQDFQKSAPSVLQNMQQQQVQQMMRQAMQPQPAGIEGLPAPNMQGMAEGGVVGYSGEDGSFVDPELEALREKLKEEIASKASPLNILGPRAEQERQRAQDLMRMLPSLDKEQMRNLLGQTSRTADVNAFQEFGPGESGTITQGPGRTAAPPFAASPEGRALAQNISAPPKFQIDPNNPQALNALRRAAMAASGVEKQALLQKVAELEASAPNTVPQPVTQAVPQAAPQRGIAALPVSPTFGSAMKEAEQALPGTGTEQNRAELQRLQDMRRARPDTGQMTSKALEEESGVAAALKAKLDQSAQNRGIMSWLMGGEGRGASARSYEGFRKAEDQRQMLHAQENTIRVAKIEAIKEANEARKIGDQESYVNALNKISELERADKQVKATLAANIFQTQGSIRGQDIQALTAQLNKEAQAALHGAPTYKDLEEQRVIQDLMKNDPTLSYADARDQARGAGKGLGLRETSVELKALKDEEAQLLKRLEATFSPKERQPIIERLDQISKDRVKMMGGANASSVGQLPAAAASQLKEGLVTTFANGQKWTLQNGQPTQVK